MKLLIISIFLTFSSLDCHRVETYVGLDRVREWRLMDFQFPNASVRAEAIQSGFFIPENVILLDSDIQFNQANPNSSRIFVILPRFLEGVPITLGYVTARNSDLQIKPYPSYEWHTPNGENCDFMSSVFRITFDRCNQLWVIDSGSIGGEVVCPPQILIFNVTSDQLLHRYVFPASQYRSFSLFNSMALDQDPSGNCMLTKAYITDVDAVGLLVYDRNTNRSWRIQNKYFYPYPQYGTLTIAGESFELMDGIFTTAISPRRGSNTNNRVLYFHSLASEFESSVPLNLINNETIWNDDAWSEPDRFKIIGKRGVQTPAQTMDSNGNLFFILLNPLALVCWDSSTTYNRENIKVLYQNNITLQFTSSIKVIRNGNGEEELIITTNRLQKFWTGNVEPFSVNYRVQKNSIRQLLRGQTRCNGISLNSISRPVYNL